MAIPPPAQGWWFSCRKDHETRAYIISIFNKYRVGGKNDLSDKSLTVEYSIAKFENDFNRFQNIGDYIFFSKVLHEKSLTGASEDYYHSLGQLSYWSCYRMIKSWKVYQELADRFIDLSKDTKKIIHKL